MTLKEAIAKTTDKKGGTCFFNWNREKKTWCLSGDTADHLVWETDDYEAKNKKDGESDAADYLVEYNNLR